MDNKINGEQSGDWQLLLKALPIDSPIEYDPFIEIDNEAIESLNEFVTSLASKLLLKDLQATDIELDTTITHL